MQKEHPTQIIILGGGGDLAQKKLLPALFDLFSRTQLPKQFNIVGFARTVRSDNEYQTFVQDVLLQQDATRSKTTIEAFCEHISYVSGDFDTEASYESLSEKVSAFQNNTHEQVNTLFYLAVPPRFYKQIFTQLHKHALVAKKETKRWSRILVEKPFGKDLQTARALEKQLSSLFFEEQIFRIDHYLAKEAVQNILSFRFANTLFKDVWNKDSIESVHIAMHETADVSTRGNFYDGVGALRDVGQNHLLQLLALVAMEEPSVFSAEVIRACRANVLQKVKLAHTLETAVIRGQYEGYTKEEIVPTTSQTETFFSLIAQVHNKRWKGVPFYIEAGKALHQNKVSITVIFKDSSSGLFDTSSCKTASNSIELTISPEQTLSVTLNAKAPGLKYQIEQRPLSITCASQDEIKNSYEKVLRDCIVGDQTLFTSTDEVFASWKFITPILKQWSTLPLHTYQKGSAGPKVVQ